MRSVAQRFKALQVNRTPLGVRVGLGTQPCKEASADLLVEIINKQ